MGDKISELLPLSLLDDRWVETFGSEDGISEGVDAYWLRLDQALLLIRREAVPQFDASLFKKSVRIHFD